MGVAPARGSRRAHLKVRLAKLRLSDHRVGLLMNFNVARLNEGIVRIVIRL
jgi:hypothetical protein